MPDKKPEPTRKPMERPDPLELEADWEEVIVRNYDKTFFRLVKTEYGIQVYDYTKKPIACYPLKTSAKILLNKHMMIARGGSTHA